MLIGFFFSFFFLNETYPQSSVDKRIHEARIKRFMFKSSGSAFFECSDKTLAWKEIS